MNRNEVKIYLSEKCYENYSQHFAKSLFWSSIKTASVFCFCGTMVSVTGFSAFCALRLASLDIGMGPLIAGSAVVGLTCGVVSVPLKMIYLKSKINKLKDINYKYQTQEK